MFAPKHVSSIHRVAASLKALRGLQAAQAPHADVSGQEVDRAVRLSEHLLHLQRKQRGSLATTAKLCCALGSLDALLSQFNPAAAESAAAAAPHFLIIGRVSSEPTTCLPV